MTDAAGAGRQRIDRWLWHARLVRTRAAAQALATSGHVRVNRERIDTASRAVKSGDVLTIALAAGVRVLKVVAFSERRGPAPEAQRLYEDLAPPAARPAAATAAPKAEGRPDRHGRRAAIDLKHGGRNDLPTPDED